MRKRDLSTPPQAIPRPKGRTSTGKLFPPGLPETKNVRVYRGIHARAVSQRAGVSQSDRPALLVSGLAADGSYGQPFQLPSGPGHYSAVPARGRSREHGFPGLLRRETQNKLGLPAES